MRKENKKSAARLPKAIKGNVIIRIFQNRIEIMTPSKGIFRESLSLELLKIREIPKGGLEAEVLSIKPIEAEKVKPVSAKRKKPAVKPKPKPKPVAKPKKVTKNKEEKEKPTLENKNKLKPKKAEKKSLTIKDAELVGTSQLPGAKKLSEVYEAGNALYLRKDKGQKLTRLIGKRKYAAVLKKFKEVINLPEEYINVKLIIMDTIRPKLTDQAFDRFVLTALAKGDLKTEAEGEKMIVKLKENPKGPQSPH